MLLLIVDVETTVRAKCREKFSEAKLMRRLIKNVDEVLGYGDRSGAEEAPTIGFLWDDQVEWVEGGQDWLAHVPVTLPDLPTFVEEELDYDCADS